jgi:hypothetical protein
MSETGTTDLRTLANGALYDMQKKRIVANPGGGSRAFSQADGSASASAQKRWQKYRQAAATGIVREAMAIDPSVRVPADAWRVVTAKQYVALLDADKPRVDDLYRMGQIVGALPLAGEVQAQAQAPAGGLAVRDADAIVLMLVRASVGITDIISTDEYIDADMVVDAEEGQE